MLLLLPLCQLPLQAAVFTALNPWDHTPQVHGTHRVLPAVNQWMMLSWHAAAVLHRTELLAAPCTAGTSMYGFNPANGRINRHVDTW
jgi:hypothetical protein